MLTTGVLQVLRDPYHYYGLTLVRDSTSVIQGEDDSIYAYRQISDTELVRIAMLSLEKGIIDTGMEERTTGTWSLFNGATIESVPGYLGTFSWLQDSSSKFNWYIADYVPGFSKAPGKNTTVPGVLVLSDPNTSGNRRGRKEAKSIKFFCYDETSSFSASKLIPLSVSPSNAYDISLDSYTATINFAVNSSTFAAQVVRNGATTSTFSISDKENVKKWCPINIDGNGHNEESTTYLWWN